MAGNCVHFTTVCMDPTNFRIKILETSTLGAKCYLNVARSAPDMKITTFCKVLPERAQNANFHAFSKGTDRGFSMIFDDFWSVSDSYGTFRGDERPRHLRHLDILTSYGRQSVQRKK